MADPFDDRLRSELRESIGHSYAANTTLDELVPSLRRARRRHVLQRGVAGVAGVLMVAGLAATVVTNQRSEDRTSVIAAAPVTETRTTNRTETSTDVVSGTSVTTSDKPEVSAVASTITDSAISSTTSPTSLAPSTSVEPTSTEPTTGPPESSTTSTSTTSTSTTEADSSEETVDSNCGSIVVAVDGTDVSLVRATADPGFETDIKKAGPEKVEVSFEGTSGHCELDAEVRNGQFWFEVDSE